MNNNKQKVDKGLLVKNKMWIELKDEYEKET